MFTGLRIVRGEEVDRDEAGEEDVKDADSGEGVEFFVLDEMPDSVGERDDDREAHRDVGA